MQAALFDLPLQDLRQVTVYRSGMSRPADFQGFAAAGAPVGVQILDTSARVRAQIVDYLDRGGQVFVDSGAFPAFMRGVAVDFPLVLARYQELAQRTRRPQNLALVFPDVVGDQAATLALLAEHQVALRQLLSRGVDALVPFHRGPLKQFCAFDRVAELLGTRDFRPAIPANRAALPARDLTELLRHARPQRIHFLGIAARRARLLELVAQVRRQCPRCDISSDANRLRSWVGPGGPLARAQTEVFEELLDEARCGRGPVDMSHWDETELIGALVDRGSWLRESDIDLIATRLRGFIDAEAFARAVRADDAQTVSDLLDDVPYELLILACEELLARDYRDELAQAGQLGRLRAQAITALEQAREAAGDSHC